MANKNQVWLKILNAREHRYEYLPGVKGSRKGYHVHSVDLAEFNGSLPEKIKGRNFADDPYRGILYFCRGIGWDKPTKGKAKGLAFLEFYWAEEIQKKIRAGHIQLDLANHELTTLEGYVEAVRVISKWMAGLKDDDPIGTSGFTAKQMGRLKLSKGEFEAALAALIDGRTPTRFLEPKDSDEYDAGRIGQLPLLGKWAYAWVARHGPRSVSSGRGIRFPSRRNR